MSVLSDLVERHTRYCIGDCCEIALNGLLLEGLDRVIDDIEVQLYKINPHARQPIIKGAMKVINDNYASLLKSVIQCCSDRPAEFRDVEFVSFLSTKYVYLKKQREYINVFLAKEANNINNSPKEKDESNA